MRASLRQPRSGPVGGPVDLRFAVGGCIQTVWCAQSCVAFVDVGDNCLCWRSVEGVGLTPPSRVAPALDHHGRPLGGATPSLVTSALGHCVLNTKFPCATTPTRTLRVCSVELYGYVCASAFVPTTAVTLRSSLSITVSGKSAFNFSQEH